MAPTPADGAAGKYPFVKHFYLIAAVNPSPALKRFTSCMQSPASRVALAVALLVALALPLGHASIAYRDLSGALEFKAHFKAAAPGPLVTGNPAV